MYELRLKGQEKLVLLHSLSLGAENAAHGVASGRAKGVRGVISEWRHWGPLWVPREA